MNPSGYRSNPKSKERTGSSNRSQSDHHLWQLRDTASDKSLVEGGIVVTRSWSQKWHNSGGRTRVHKDGEMEHELDTIV